ncbi:MAG: MmcQ/YjbR family DNA-binding protein [Pseudomonadota bacterium]
MPSFTGLGNSAKQLFMHSTSDQDVDRFATSHPSVFMTEQWMGSHVYKVGTPDKFKMFAILNPGKAHLTLKLSSPETADLLIEAGVASRNVHLPRGGWVMLHLNQLEPSDVADRISDSYETVAATLPKTVRQKLGIN